MECLAILSLSLPFLTECTGLTCSSAHCYIQNYQYWQTTASVNPKDSITWNQEDHSIHSFFAFFTGQFPIVMGIMYLIKIWPTIASFYVNCCWTNLLWSKGTSDIISLLHDLLAPTAKVSSLCTSVTMEIMLAIYSIDDKFHTAVHFPL